MDPEDTESSIGPDGFQIFDDNDALVVRQHLPLEDDEPEEEEEEEATVPTESTFDMTLPTMHSYLGDNLKELRGRTLLDDGIYKNFPLLVKYSFTLFPGQTLPMNVYGPRYTNMLRNCVEKDRIFGVVCLNGIQMVHIGTTAEIYEYYEGNHDASHCQLKAKGRQRFKILRIIRQDYEILSANVKVLPEITLDPPFLDYRLASLDHLRIQPSTEQELKKDELKQREFVEKIDSIITPWPAWVYRQYDPWRLSWKIRQHLQYLEQRGSNIPKDPIELSFWVAQNVLVDNKERIDLLEYDSAITRLQKEIKYLIEDRSFICAECGAFIAHQSNMFPMSKEGLQSTYCNTFGAIFETITVHHAEGLNLDANPPSTAYSWFPGYAWTIANCKSCYSHIGWKFTAVKKHLKPESFWGLCRKSLKNKTNKKMTDTGEDDVSTADN